MERQMVTKKQGAIKSIAHKSHKAIRDTTAEIFEIDAAILAENIALHNTEQDNLLKQVETSAVINSVEISILNFYCSKTGRKIGQRDLSEIEQMVNFYGLEYAEQLAEYIDMTVSCSPVWLVTNPEQLDKLMILDPCGYFVYAASYALQRVNEFWNKDKGWKNQKARLEFQNQKIISYQLLQNLPVDTIIAANEIWRKTLAVYHPRAIGWPFGLVSEYCNINAIDILQQNIMRQVEQVLFKMDEMNWLRENWNLMELVIKQGGGKDFNNFLRQRGMRGESLELAVTRIFADFGMLDVNINEIVHVPRGKPMTKYDGEVTKQKTLIKIADKAIVKKPDLRSLLGIGKD